MNCFTRYIFWSVLLLPAAANAQKFSPPEPEPRNKGNVFLFHVSLGGQLPAADLADRFGVNGAYGGGLEICTEGNFIAGLEGHAVFGQNVKDDPLSILRTPEGHIIGNNRALAVIQYRERGLYAGALIGKIFTFGEERQGLRATLGAGWMRHRIKTEDSENALTQITGDYAKGYDRLCAGIAFNQFIGWQKLGKYRRQNFLIGLEFIQGITETKRDWDYSERKKLSGKRLDLRFGIKAAWTIPFYLTKSSEIYY